MNYLRGAVSAISAPYQYYKDLNPSTLTGAIDVIVVRRPKNIAELPPEAPPRQLTDEETELVCSPFHVRFGKWQVLRPQDKKVDVFVNGQLVPFSMKIGEAGEAFFVFETDEDVPDSLVTSPILEATKPGQTNAQAREAGRFGAGAPSPQPRESQGSSQEPEFLDLDASADSQSRDDLTSSPVPPAEKSQGDGSDHPSVLSRTAELGKAMLGVAHEVERTGADKLKDQSVKEALKEAERGQREFVKDRTAATLNVAQNAAVNFPSLDDKGDEILPEAEMENVHEPDVRYTDSMVFDVEGYHAQSHGREASDATLKSRPRGSSPSDTSSPDRTPGPSRTPSPSPSTPPSSSVAFPTFRATSEPPPDHDDFPEPSSSRLANTSNVTRTPSASVAPRPHLSALPANTSDTEEYTWDWGNFPQKTPIRTSFPHALGHGHGHGHLTGASMDLTPRKGKGRMVSEEPDAEQLARGRTGVVRDQDNASYGLGGRLTVDKKDPTRFRVFIEGRAVEFELAIVPPVDGDRPAAGPLGGEDEVEDDKRFEQNKVDFDRFLNEAWIVEDANLVLRWAGDKYIQREDGSPLMDALVTWRESALRDKHSHLSSRPTSPQPLSEDDAIRSEGDEPASGDRRPKRSVTATGTESATDSTGRAPTSSSWVRWWSRSRRTEAARPDLSHTSSEPSAVVAAKLRAAEASAPVDTTSAIRRTATSASAPPLPSTPESNSSTGSTPTRGTPEPDKRFAKTLRLTSDQLKSLNLKSGANSVTFSLSATGVAACSARLFVWDYTDSVVVSDIDGTITKSDALGHVFTMIGRDWTHMGVAKLYTDICRNGYKIMYLTSRAIGQADSTREYLKGIKQNEYQLPEGPVIMSPDRLMASLHREVIMRKPEVFKMACLRDIQKLFGGPTHNPFYAGFGNRITDALSYRSVSIPSSRIFTIDSTGEVKMELLELAGYKSSYIHMTDLVDQMFPPINRKWASEYTDFNYWKAPIQDFPLPDLSPPSPALSARSDTSNQSTFARLRNFSLVSGRQSKPQFTLPPPATEGGQAAGSRMNGDIANENRLRQMSSFERLSSTLASLTQSSSSTVGSPRSSSPTLNDEMESDSEYDEDEEGGDVEGQKMRRKRQRRRSMSSMPGSLPGSEPGSDDEMVFGEDDDEDHGYEGENEEDVPDEALDEALFAAGEMKNVDYI